MDMYERHSQSHAKSQECFSQLQAMGVVPKSKMSKFYRNVSSAWNELDREFVNCRRLKKITLKYTELEVQFDECVTVFGQWGTFTALMY